MPGLTAADERTYNEDLSGQLVVGTTTDDTTLATARNANTTIFIQTLAIEVVTGSATTWNFKDSAGTPISIAGTLDVSTAPSQLRFDFGAKGYALTEGKNFLLDVGATGAAGRIVWEAYQRLTSAVALSSAA